MDIETNREKRSQFVETSISLTSWTFYIDSCVVELARVTMRCPRNDSFEKMVPG